MLKLVTTNQNFFLILYTLIMDGRLLMGRPWRVAQLYILWAQVPATSGFLVGSMSWLRVDQAEGENSVATWFRFRNQIGPFGPLTFMHRYAYQIMSLKFGYGLERC